MNKIMHINEIILEIDEETFNKYSYGDKITFESDLETILLELRINVTEVLKFKYLNQDWETNIRRYKVKYI